MEGLASCWTCTMKVLSSVSEEREGGSSESVAVEKKRMRERKKEGDGAIDEGCEGVLWCETKFKEEKGEGEWSSTGVDVAVDVSACVCDCVSMSGERGR